MRTILTGFLAILTFAAPAFADDFGSRFNNQAPLALEENDLQNIEPAAGEPAMAETELEQKFQTEVNSTTQNLGDGQVRHHDSVGDGDVRVFYRNQQDERVMDKEDAVGVEMKLLELE